MPVILLIAQSHGLSWSESVGPSPFQMGTLTTDFSFVIAHVTAIVIKDVQPTSSTPATPGVEGVGEKKDKRKWRQGLCVTVLARTEQVD